MRRCPQCGFPLETRSIDVTMIIDRMPLGRVARRILTYLAKRFGCWVSGQDLAAYVYADRDGGPLDTAVSITNSLRFVKKRLANVGLWVQGRPRWGRRLLWIAAE